jgi:hypothetical protein
VVLEVPPVPVNATAWGKLPALSYIVRVPVLVPDAVGVNFTLAVQLAPAAKLILHVPVLAVEKSPVKANVVLKLSEVLPVFVTVTYCVELVEPTATLPKLSEVGDSETAGPLAVTGAEMVTLALADLVVSATLTAVAVTEPPLGTLAGAV